MMKTKVEIKFIFHFWTFPKLGLSWVQSVLFITEGLNGESSDNGNHKMSRIYSRSGCHKVSGDSGPDHPLTFLQTSPQCQHKLKEFQAPPTESYENKC